MTDVIFNGTDRRLALGMAEGSLVFDNKDRVSTVDGRRGRRHAPRVPGGEGEYLIDKQPSRLKDVREMLPRHGPRARRLRVHGAGQDRRDARRATPWTGGASSRKRPASRATACASARSSCKLQKVARQPAPPRGHHRRSRSPDALAQGSRRQGPELPRGPGQAQGGPGQGEPSPLPPFAARGRRGRQPHPHRCRRARSVHPRSRPAARAQRRSRANCAPQRGAHHRARARRGIRGPDRSARQRVRVPLEARGGAPRRASSGNRSETARRRRSASSSGRISSSRRASGTISRTTRSA